MIPENTAPGRLPPRAKRPASRGETAMTTQTTGPKVATPRPARRVRVVPSILPPILPAPKPAPKPAPTPPPKAQPKLVTGEPPALRNIWVKGKPVGINHTYGARGKQAKGGEDAALAALLGGKKPKSGPMRYKTPAAKAWEKQVYETTGYVALASHLLGPTAWNVDDTRRGAPVLAIDLRFVYQPATNLTRPDADAAQKLTLDALSKGLGLDDRVVKRVTSSITLAPTPQTPTGCLISIERLAPDVVAEADRLLLATITQLDHTGALSTH